MKQEKKHRLSKCQKEALLFALDTDGDLPQNRMSRNTFYALRDKGLATYDGPGWGYKETWVLTPEGIRVAKNLKVDEQSKAPKATIILDTVRRAVADYISSEGCSCCQNVNEHKKHAEALGKLLLVDQYSDKSGYNFNKYKTVPPKEDK